MYCVTSGPRKGTKKLYRPLRSAATNVRKDVTFIVLLRTKEGKSCSFPDHHQHQATSIYVPPPSSPTIFNNFRFENVVFNLE